MSVSWVAPAMAVACSFYFTPTAIDSQLVDPSFVPVQLDFQARSAWIKSQPLKYRNSTRFLAQHIQVISNMEFEQTLRDLTHRLIESIEPTDRVVLVSPGSGSHLWITRYAQALNPNLSEVQIIDPAHILSVSFPDAGNVHLVFLDDAAYSGEQLKDSVRFASKSLIHLSPEKRARLHIHFFRVFGTRRAFEIAANECFGPSLRRFPEVRKSLQFGFFIPTVSELLNAERSSLDLQQRVKEFLEVPAWGEFTLSMPFFKKPDDWSFPKIVMEGDTFDRRGDFHLFILGPRRGQGEPYRMHRHSKQKKEYL